MRRLLAALVVACAPVFWPAGGGGSGAGIVTNAEPDRPEPAAAEPEQDGPSPGSPGHGPMTPFRPAGSPRELLLTFDDGPELRLTPLVMQELDRRGMKGIFFISGWRLVGDRPEVLARRDLVRKLASHGHLVANHTMTHKNLCQHPRLAAGEIDGNSELIAAAAGLRPLLFRSPYGAFCRSLAEALVARELTDVGWNIDPQDWKEGVGQDEAYEYFVRKLGKLEGRGIMLLHDTHSASVHALPRILDWIEHENQRAVSQGQPPIKVLDYTWLLPARPMAPTGLGPIVASLAASFDALPGLR